MESYQISLWTQAGDAIDRFVAYPSEESYCHMFTVLMPRIITYFRVRGWGRDVAEDLAQEVMLAAYQHSSRLRSRELFRPWLYKVARNNLWGREVGGERELHRNRLR